MRFDAKEKKAQIKSVRFDSTIGPWKHSATAAPPRRRTGIHQDFPAKKTGAEIMHKKNVGWGKKGGGLRREERNEEKQRSKEERTRREQREKRGVEKRREMRREAEK